MEEFNRQEYRPTVNELEKAKVRKEQTTYMLQRLRKAGIKRCDIEQNAIKGMHQGQPFVVWYRMYSCSNGEFVSEVQTIFKGKHIPEEDPTEVLKR